MICTTWCQLDFSCISHEWLFTWMFGVCCCCNLIMLMIGVIVWCMYLAPENIPGAIVLWLVWLYDECTWHHKTFLVQLYWHLAIKLHCVVNTQHMSKEVFFSFLHLLTTYPLLWKALILPLQNFLFFFQTATVQKQLSNTMTQQFLHLYIKNWF